MTQRKYTQYLRTPYWLALSSKIKKRDKNRCVICNSNKDLQVHHRNYEGVPYREKLYDLYTLCDTCHGYATKRMKSLKIRKHKSSVIHIDTVSQIACANDGLNLVKKNMLEVCKIINTPKEAGGMITNELDTIVTKETMLSICGKN